MKTLRTLQQEAKMRKEALRRRALMQHQLNKDDNDSDSGNYEDHSDNRYENNYDNENDIMEPEPVKPSSRHFFEEGEDQEGEGEALHEEREAEEEEREAFSNSEEENDNYTDEAMCQDMEEKVDQKNSTDSLKDAIHDSDDLLSNMDMPSLPLTPDLAPLSPSFAQTNSNSMNVVVAASAVAAASQASAQYTLLPAKPRNYSCCSAGSEQSPLLSSNSSLSSGWLDSDSLEWGQLQPCTSPSTNATTPNQYSSDQLPYASKSVPVPVQDINNSAATTRNAILSITRPGDGATTEQEYVDESSTSTSSSSSSDEEDCVQGWAAAAQSENGTWKNTLGGQQTPVEGEDGTTILWERSKEEVMTATLDLTLIHPHEHDELHHNHHHQVVGEDFEDHSENSSDCSDSTSSQESSDTAEKELYGPTSAAETAAIAASNSPADAQQDRLSCSKAAASNICVINSLIASLES